MDDRAALPAGTSIRLGGTSCRIEAVLGRGANALAYRAVYRDEVQPDQIHRVLMKELFPWRPEGGIARAESGALFCAPEAEEFFASHRESFLRGNQVHLELQQKRADKVPLNFNTYQVNGTLYTLMGDSGGRTLRDALQGKELVSLKTLAYWMRNLLYSLRAFHQQGLLHLDVSPDNIVLQPLDQGKSEAARELLLIDYNSVWSLAELKGKEELFLSLKEPYSAPELRLRDLVSAGPASDLYSVCVVFLACLLGEPPSGFLRKIPPVGNAAPLKGVSATVFHQVLAILRKGLRSSPKQRYQTADEAIADFSELLQRLDRGGVTRAALWEASLNRCQTDLKRLPVGAEIGEIADSKREALLQLEEGSSCILTGGSGSGKTSMLISLCYRGTRRYDPSAPVPVYIPLYAYDGKTNYLRRVLLNLLRFSPGQGWEDAEHALTQLLETPVHGKPSVRLLLDGADEAGGDLRPLLSELRALERTGGVQIITAARQMLPELGLPERQMPPLMDGEIERYLKLHGLPRPIGGQLDALLHTPVFLAMYRDICKQTGGMTEAVDENGLLTSYLGTLVSSHREAYGGDAGFQAEFAVNVLLPFLAYQMNGQPRISPGRVYSSVRECFSMLRSRSFSRIFPRLMGRSGVIQGGCADAEAWFALIVRDLLERRMSLLWQDEQGDYHLFHQHFQSLLAQRWLPIRKRLAGTWIRRCALCSIPVLISVMIFCGWVRQTHPETYPRTSQERRTANTAINQLAVSCSLADLHYQAWGAVLDAASEELLRGSESAWEDWQSIKERELASVKLLDMPVSPPEEIMLELEEAPVPISAMKDLYALPEQLREEFPKRVDALEKCLAPGSGYPERDKREAVELFHRLLESETAGTFLLVGQVISSLDEDAVKPLLDFLPHTVSWREQLRQADWTGTDYESGLAACRDEQRDLRNELAALGLLPYKEG